MLDALRKRFEDDEEGFTLIELMVVVLIIGILVAIAVPTFLNAQDNAKSKAAQSNARSALSAAKTLHAENETYQVTSQAGTLTALQAAEPSLDWGASGAPSTKVDEISWITTATQITIAVRANNGDCFFVRDSVDTTTAATRGTYFGKLTGTVAATGCDADGTQPNYRQSQSDGWPKSGVSLAAPVTP